jgi:hypothetical protein
MAPLTSPCLPQLKLPGYQPLTIHLPCTLLPNTVRSILTRPPGSVRKVTLLIIVSVDTRNISEFGVDPGSKQWLVARALDTAEDGPAHASNDGADNNPYREENEKGATGTSGHSDANKQQGKDDDEELPEDKFHVKLPKNVDKYTGLPINGADEAGKMDDAETVTLKEEGEELPEDRFHKKDAQSSYIIEQREQAIKDKWERSAKFVIAVHATS